jgi:hypothetical protein
MSVTTCQLTKRNKSGKDRSSKWLSLADSNKKKSFILLSEGRERTVMLYFQTRSMDEVKEKLTKGLFVQ